MQLQLLRCLPPCSHLILFICLPLLLWCHPPIICHHGRAATLLGDDCLLVVKNPKRHAYLRTLLAPAFSADAISSYLPDIQVLVGRHLASWEDAGQAGIKAHKALKLLTFDFIMQVRY